MPRIAIPTLNRTALRGCVVSARTRRRIARHCVWWCAAWILLSALQPFMAVHFRGTGWEDEPGLHVRSGGESARFEYDDDDAQGADRHRAVLETTVFVPLGVDGTCAEPMSQLLGHLLIGWMAMPGLSLVDWLVTPSPGLRPEHPNRHATGPPADTSPWRNVPPQTAPPSWF